METLQQHGTAWKVLVFGVFLVPIFPCLDWMIPYLSVVSPNAGKYGPKQLQIRTLFTQYGSYLSLISSKLCLDSRFQRAFRIKWWKGHYWLVEHKDLLHSIYWRLGSLCRKSIAFRGHRYIWKQSIAEIRDAKVATVESIEAYYWYWIALTR